MPRYYFNTYDGHTTLDKEGAELSGLRAARRRAIRLAGTLIESDVARLQLGEDWRMEVTDDQGHLLFRLDFTVLEFRGKPELSDIRRTAI